MLRTFGSAVKPKLQNDLTNEAIIIGFSRPWNSSTVPTSTPCIFFFCKFCFMYVHCNLYGEITPISFGFTPNCWIVWTTVLISSWLKELHDVEDLPSLPATAIKITGQFLFFKIVKFCKLNKLAENREKKFIVYMYMKNNWVKYSKSYKKIYKNTRIYVLCPKKIPNRAVKKFSVI